MQSLNNCEAVFREWLLKNRSFRKMNQRLTNVLCLESPDSVGFVAEGGAPSDDLHDMSIRSTLTYQSMNRILSELFIMQTAQWIS
jgi:hypothetical protein